MDAIKAFLTNTPPNPDQTAATLTLLVSSMSRLFCELESGEKIFTISFPFCVHEANGQLEFYSRENILIDNRVSSEILALIGNTASNGVLEAADFAQFIDPIIDATEVDASLWTLLRELMLAEDAYLRYDMDHKNLNGHQHPVHHIDISYTSSGTFKIGLYDKLSCEKLISILDSETDCHYLSHHQNNAKI